MLSRIPALILAALVVPLTACAPAGEELPTEEAATTEEPEAPMQGALEGAWKVTEVSFESPDTSWTDADPQPSLYIFAKQDYSIMHVPSGPDGSSQPRELFSGDEPIVGSSEPTDAEKLAAYDSFIANSGTYEVSGSTLTTRPIVAKNPNFMSGGSLTYTYEIEGDTLRLTLTLPWAPENETRYTLVRLE